MNEKEIKRKYCEKYKSALSVSVENKVRIYKLCNDMRCELREGNYGYGSFCWYSEEEIFKSYVDFYE